MSQVKQMLEIKAPGAVRSHPERMSVILKCGACHGGGIHTTQTGHSTFHQQSCQVCQQSGMVIAKIEINYQPYKITTHEPSF